MMSASLIDNLGSTIIRVRNDELDIPSSNASHEYRGRKTNGSRGYGNGPFQEPLFMDGYLDSYGSQWLKSLDQWMQGKNNTCRLMRWADLEQCQKLVLSLKRD